MRKKNTKQKYPPKTPVINKKSLSVEPKTESIYYVPSALTVKEFSDILQIPVSGIITALIKNGVMATINEVIDAETAIVIGDELGFNIQEKAEETITPLQIEDKPEDLIPRPPVVTVMGHVDHGKTTLLDTIRKTKVASGEAGGITQHIGAYQVTIRDPNTDQDRLITFLDTPGHEAFSAMRAHGALITDIIILVVAADDGVKPQTIEVINHAKTAHVPIVVAINKIDTQGANQDRVMQDLANRELVPEKWGGKTIMVPISAKSGEGITDLLNMVLLTADLLELKTNPHKPGVGIVIESHMQSGLGPLATILVNDGTFNINDSVVIGHTYGKIRIMEDFRLKRIKKAHASMPIRIAGLQDVPQFGEYVITVPTEKEARHLTQVKSAIKHSITSSDTSSAVSEKRKHKELNVILKTDVQGSLEAISQAIKSLKMAGVSVKIIHDSVGDINESDINMAIASKAIIIGFRVGIKPQVKELAERSDIKISIYEIIYQLLDDLYSVLSGLVTTELVDVKIGAGKILKIFRSEKDAKVIGVKITSGQVTPDAAVVIYRDDQEQARAKIDTLQQGQTQVNIVTQNNECGIRLLLDFKIAAGDTLEFYQQEEKIVM